MEKIDAGSQVRSHLFSIGLSVQFRALDDLQTDDCILEVSAGGQTETS